MVQIVKEMPRVGRKLRRPTHSFHLRSRPFQIQPFMIAPVLPGETMKNLVMQSRVVTDPVKNPLIGWWQEYYWFYVKHRDLDARDTLTAMMLDVELDAHSLDETVGMTEYYSTTSEIPWAKLCLKRIVEEYFRDEGEAWDTWKLGNLPIASINSQTWLDSVINRSDLPEGDVPAGTETVGELDKQRVMWETMQAMTLTNMTYEEWLATYGVRQATVELHKPELIRYVRDWQYPSNTVDPTTGTPSSAVSWAIAERGDKDRFFKEPGFIVGVTVSRPKVYLRGQTTPAVSMMDNAFSWLPAIMRDEVYTSLKEFTTGTGPLRGITDDYVVDVRDLLMYGDQFVNFDVAATDAGLVALPTAAMQKRFPASADVDALFKAASPANQVRQDGVCTLAILGTQQDHT